jgi:hypothetical protein
VGTPGGGLLDAQHRAGIKLHPQIADPAMRALVQREWAHWTDQTDFNGRNDFYGFQQAVLRSVVVSARPLCAWCSRPTSGFRSNCICSGARVPRQQ